MERDTRYFLIILFFIIALTSMTIVLQFNYDKQLEKSINALTGNFNKQQSKITILDQNLQDLNQNFDMSLENIESSISEVKEEQKDKFSSLSGQLRDVEKKSKDLESKLLNIDVTSQDFSNIIEAVINSVVSVRTDKGLGSGVIIDSKGYVVTNYHVIDGISSAAIYTYEGKSYSIVLIGLDKYRDLAVLKIVSNESFEELKFGRSDDLKVGEKVIALGNPAGLDFTVTEGIISALNRPDESGKLFVQTDVTINPGNSGGPLINAAGRIVGINTFKISGQYEGLGFAIPSNDVKDIVFDLIDQVK